MATESDGGVWTTPPNPNDTLTISPTTNWSNGAGRTLTVNATDVAGNPLLTTVNLTYNIGNSSANVITTPGNGAIISASQSVVLVFDNSMNTGSLILGGNLATESDGGIWSTTTLVNDTLTISPGTSWTAGIHLGNANPELTINVSDAGNNPLVTLTRDYDVNL